LSLKLKRWAKEAKDLPFACLLLDGFVVEPPEEVAKGMRPYFT